MDLTARSKRFEPEQTKRHQKTGMKRREKKNIRK
jgi:hypothetical protein